MERYAHFLNCKILHFPFTYLCIPIGANPRLVDTWKPIVHKFEKKLSRWKYKIMSFVGRLSLINSVLTSLPLLFFQSAKLCGGKLVSIQRKILWDSEERKNKICWKSWDKICQPKKHGGHGGNTK